MRSGFGAVNWHNQLTTHRFFCSRGDETPSPPYGGGCVMNILLTCFDFNYELAPGNWQINLLPGICRAPGQVAESELAKYSAINAVQEVNHRLF